MTTVERMEWKVIEDEVQVLIRDGFHVVIHRDPSWPRADLLAMASHGRYTEAGSWRVDVSRYNPDDRDTDPIIIGHYLTEQDARTCRCPGVGNVHELPCVNPPPVFDLG